MSLGDAVADDAAGGWAGPVGWAGFSVLGGFEKRDPGLDFASVMESFVEDARPVAARKSETDDPGEPKATVLSALVSTLGPRGKAKTPPKRRRRQKDSSKTLRELTSSYTPKKVDGDLTPLAVLTVPAEYQEEDEGDFQAEVINDNDGMVHLDDYRTFFDEGDQVVP